MAFKNKKSNQKNTMTDSVDNVVLEGVLKVADSRKQNAWEGTMTDLNSMLVRVLGTKKSKMLPGSPSSLRVVLNRIMNRLRVRGVKVTFGRMTDRVRTRFVQVF